MADCLKSGLSQLSQTPVKRGCKIPTGHILVCERWRGTSLASALQNGVNVLYEDRLGIVDFHPSNEMGVVYINEAELITGNLYKRKVAKLRRVSHVKGIVIVEKTDTSKQYYSALQKFVALELGLMLIPVLNQTDAAKLLVQMVHLENNPSNNQFRKKRKTIPIDAMALSTLQTVPRLGDIKARLLLKKFKSIHSVATASEEELTQVVGKASATNIRSFFNLSST